MTPSRQETRDELLQQAIRLYNELARIDKEVLRVARYERPPLQARAAEIGAELRAIMHAHRQASR
jgi:hypothetical protein